MTKRSEASKAADKHFKVTFKGLNPLGSETYSSKKLLYLRRNMWGREDFIAGYETCLRVYAPLLIPKEPTK